jgi:hypothetical protein
VGQLVSQTLHENEKIRPAWRAARLCHAAFISNSLAIGEEDPNPNWPWQLSTMPTFTNLV